MTPRFTDVTYEELEEGRKYGPYEYDLTSHLFTTFVEGMGYSEEEREFYKREGVAPPAYVTTVFLKVIQDALSGIPPGAILAKQELQFQNADLHRGEPHRGSMVVDEKYQKRENPYVHLEFAVENHQGDVAVTGSKTIIWPD